MRNLDSETGEVSMTDRRFKSFKIREIPTEHVSRLRRNSTTRRNPQDIISLRQSNYKRSLTNKQRVIKMLFVVVLEFFVCWTPLYVINTLALFWPQLIYQTVGYKTISFCHLLAYSSGCCNPITYCFMNRGFRNSFLNLFHCCRQK